MYRTRRLLTIGWITLVFLLLLIRDAAVAYRTTSFLSSTLHFCFSTLVASAFLSMGAFVWYYAYNRLTAHLLFGFSSAMAITFAVQSGAVANDFLLSATASVSSLVALLCLNAFLLVFPSSNIGWPPAAREGVGRRGAAQARPRALVRLLRGYLCAQTALCLTAIGDTALYFLLGPRAPAWLPLIVRFYVFAGLVGVIASVLLSYRYAPGLRERQQLRLLVNGTVFAIAPFLILTLFPSLLGYPAQLVVDSRISTATLVLLPLALGYAILRYQLLFFEAPVRRVVATLVGLLSLALLAYLVIAVSTVVLPSGSPGQIGAAVVALVALGSLTWWGARAATERLFFTEIRHYRRLFSRPERLRREIHDLAEAAWLVAAAVVDAFETAACVFLLDEEAGCLRPHFPLNKRDSQRLAGQVFRLIQPVAIQGKTTDCLSAEDPILVRLSRAGRPLLLSKIGRAEEALRPLLLASTGEMESDPLLAPLKVGGRMIGVLVLGPRGDQMAYAGPDFEVIDLIGRCFTPALEAARLYAQESAYAALLLKLFTGLPAPLHEERKTLEAVAGDYARVIASAASIGAEPWLVEERDGVRILRRLLHVGVGPPLALPETIGVEELQERSCLAPTFLTWQRPVDLLEALSGARPTGGGSGAFSCAWVPLVRGAELYGVLALTYARPHAFSQRERHLLSLFAQQCAAALENTRVLLDLEAARASEIEGDRSRDAFLLEAARALRVPVSTVGGYVELVKLFGDRLSPDARADFLAHAQRTSNELILQVSTIMDALQLTDLEQTSLEPVSLLGAIRDIQGFLQGRLRLRSIDLRIDVPPDLRVLADALRMRQVVLNLLSSAIAQVPAGGALEVSAWPAGHEVEVAVRRLVERVPEEQGQRRPASLVTGAAAWGGTGGPWIAISQQQVERMGGHLWSEGATSAAAGGTMFSFTLASVGAQEENQGQALRNTSQLTD